MEQNELMENVVENMATETDIGTKGFGGLLGLGAAFGLGVCAKLAYDKWVKPWRQKRKARAEENKAEHDDQGEKTEKKTTTKKQG